MIDQRRSEFFSSRGMLNGSLVAMKYSGVLSIWRQVLLVYSHSRLANEVLYLFHIDPLVGCLVHQDHRFAPITPLNAPDDILESQSRLIGSEDPTQDAINEQVLLHPGHTSS
jgi:hypothetical protein